MAQNGQVFKGWNRVLFKEALELITRRSKSPTSLVTVCVAPPIHTTYTSHTDPAGKLQLLSELGISVAQKFGTLASHGKSLGLSFNMWW